MEETAETPISTENDEQISEEGGDNGDDEENEITDVIPSPNETDPSTEDDDADPSKPTVPAEPTENEPEELEDLTPEPEPEKDPADIPAEEPGEQISAVNIAPDAVEVTEATVTVQNIRKETQKDENGKDTEVTVDGESSDAEVHFTGGCVNDSKLVSGSDLTFKVEPGAGRIVKEVTYKLSDTDKPKTLSGPLYKITKGTLITSTGAKGVTIYVETIAAGYSVSFENADEGVADSYAIYEVTTDKDDNEVLKKEPVGTGKVTVSTEEGAKAFALVLNDAKANKLADISLNGTAILGSDAEAETLKHLTSDTETEDVSGYLFEVDPAECGIVSNKADETAAVEVNVRALYQLTVSDIDTSAVVGSTAELKAPAAAEAGAKQYNFTAAGKLADTDAKKLVEGDEDYAEAKLVFDVQHSKSYKVIVSAKVGDEDVEVSEPVAVEDKTAGKATLEYAIDLSQDVLTLDANKTLAIKVSTEVNDGEDAEGVTRITFEAEEGSSLTDVIVKEKDKDPLTAAQLSAGVLAAQEGTTYTLHIQPKPGHTVKKGVGDDEETEDEDETTMDASGKSLEGKQYVSIVAERKYGDDDKTYPYNAAIGEDGTASDIEIALKGSDKNYLDDPTGTGDAKDFTTTSVTVTIGTTLDKNTDEKLVAFVDGLKADDKPSYTVTSAGAVKDEYVEDEYQSYEDDTWAIAKSASMFTFTVASAASEPAVSYKIGSDDAVTVDAAAAENGIYTYNIPTSVFAAYDADDVKTNIITIAKGKVEKTTAKVTVDDTDNLLSVGGFTYKINDATQSETLTNGKETTLTNAPAIGDTIKMVFTAKKGVTFSEATYQMGETTGAAELGTDENGRATATITAAVTGPVVVNVKTAAPYYVVLSTDADSSLDGGNGAWSADYTEKNIKIQLYKADSDATAEFYDVVVKDGNATALTKAEMVGTTAAVIKSIDEKEAGHLLTIEVAKKEKNQVVKYQATLKVSASSDEVTVTGQDGKVIDETAVISVMPDSEISFKVTPKTDANLKDLLAEIRSVDGKTDAAAKKLFTDSNITIDSDSGEINLTVAPQKEAAGQVLLCIYNPNAKTADGKVDKNKTPLKGGKITLDITAPLVSSTQIKGLNIQAGAAGNRDVSVNLGLEFTNKKSAPVAPVTGDLYYKVELKNISTSAEGVKVITKDLVEYRKIDRGDDGSYNGVNVADFYKRNLVDSYTVNGKAAPETADIPDVITAEATITLVQSLKGDLTAASKEADYVAGDTKSLSLSTLMPLYETKLSVKKLNGASVLTGQKITVASPVFTKGVSYNKVTAKFVNAKTGEEFDETDLDGNSIYKTGGTNWFTTGVNEDNTVWVQANKSVDVSTWKNNEFFKNMGVKITADAPAQGFRASTVVKISVKQGIYSVKPDESKASVPTELYQDAKGSVKSVKITTKLNSDRQTKPAKPALVWSITGEDGASVSTLDPHMREAISGAKPLISVKNGTVTVAKNYKRAATKTNEDADTFYVTAKANDFAENSASWTWKFTVTGQNQTIGKLVVVDSSNKVQDAASLKAEDFKKGNLYVAAVKTGVEDPKKGMGYTPATDFIPVTFKASGKLVTLDPIDSNKKAKINFLKPGSTKITATTVDGGKGAGTKAELTLNTGAYEKLGLFFTRSDDIESGPEVSALEYYGGSNEKYDIYLAYYDGKTWNKESAYKNVKVTAKGAKFTQDKKWAKYSGSYMGSIVGVTDKTGKATITLTDTATKNPTVYTITNKSASQAKAPSIKLYDPKKVTFDTEKITWQVTESDKTKNNYAGSYVKLTPDYTIALDKNPAYWWLGKEGNSGITQTPVKILKIDENGQFAVSTDRSDEDGIPLPYSGAYKMVATVGTMAGGEFVAAVKDVKLNFSIPKSKYNDTLKVTTGYALDAKAGAVAKIAVNTDTTYTVSDAMNVVINPKEQGVDKHANHFTDYFVVTRDDSSLWNGNAEVEGDFAYIGLRNDLNAEQIAYITDMKNKDAAADRVGYITVENYKYHQDVQIKISFTDKSKYDGSAVVFENTKNAVTVDVQILDKKTPVKIAKVRISADDSKAFASKAEVLKTDSTKITLTSVKPIASNKYEVKLDVIPENSVYAYTKDMKASGEKGAKTLSEKEIFDSYSVPATLKIEVKALDSKKITTVKSTSFTLNSKAYTEKNGNGYVLAATKGTGVYQVDVPYTLGGENLSLSTKASDKAVTVALEGNDVVIDAKAKKTEPLVSAAVTKVTVGKETKDVIRLTVSKKALNTLHETAAADKKAKVVADFGKKVTVPVTIQATNGNDKAAAETVKFNLTIPKQPMSFADVQKLVNSDATAMKNIQTAGTTTGDILKSLEDKIREKAEAVVPADTDVRVGEVSLMAIKDDEDDKSDLSDDDVKMVKGNVEASLILTDLTAAKDADATLKWRYALGIQTSEALGDSVAKAVANVIKSATLTYKNETTAKTLEDEIKALDDLETYVSGARRGNISIKVTSFEKILATTKTSGSIDATVRVLDLVTGEEQEVKLNSKTIEKPSSIVKAYNDVKTALDEKTGKKLTAIIQKCAGDSDAIKAEIEKVAREKANNPDIQITVDPFSYTGPVKAAAAEDKKDHDGKLSFTLKMKEGGREKELQGEATVAVSEADKYVEIDAAAEKLSTAILKDEDTFADGVEDALKTAVSGKTDKAAIKTAVTEAVETLCETALTDIYGFGSKVQNVDWTFATSKEPGKVTFKVVIYPLADESSTQEAVSVDAMDVGDVDKTNITKDELDEVLGDLVTDLTGGYMANETAAVTAAKKAVTDALEVTDFNGQNGYLKGASLSVTQTKDTTAEKVEEEGDAKGKIKGISIDIVIKKGEDTLYSETKAFTFAPAP